MKSFDAEVHENGQSRQRARSPERFAYAIEQTVPVEVDDDEIGHPPNGTGLF